MRIIPDNKIKFITKGIAKEIKKLRKTYTWRALADFVWKKYGKGICKKWDELPSNQLAGMDLCEYAAKKYYNQNFMEKPWN